MRIERSSPILALTALTTLTLSACALENGVASSSGAAGTGGAATSSATGSVIGSGAATGSSSTGSMSTGSMSTSSSTGSAGGAPCAAAAQQVVAIGSDKKLYKLDYVAAAPFAATAIGTLACGTMAAPYSITVDRSGVAWVVFTDGHLFKVDTTTAACSPTAFANGQHGFTSFSLAFAADAPGSAKETLYASGSGAAGGATGLAKIDTSTLTLTPIGAYDNVAVTAPVQIAGTADGKLYGGFLTAMGLYDVASIDPASAHVIGYDTTPSILIKHLPTTTDYSIIPWGNSPTPPEVTRFFIFTTEGAGTRNYFYNGFNGISTDKDPTHVTPITALTIGASTCATSNPPF